MTKPRDTNLLLYDILICAQHCVEFTEGMQFEDFERDEKTMAAVLHQIMVIGEAAKRLRGEFTNVHGHIPWSSMAKMRDVLIHCYEESNLNIVWNVVQNELPKLIKEIKQILGDEEQK